MSEARHHRASQVIPGGVNSTVRAFRSVGGSPVFMERGKGPFIYDADGKEYIDFVCSWGPLILGHAHPHVTEALHKAIEKGTSFGACTEAETLLAERLCLAVPSFEKVRLVSSGTEATLSALRLARAYTGRERFMKFRGCYHGHADSFLIEAGSGALTLGQPSSPGVTKACAQDTLLAEFNNLESVQAIFNKYGDSISCVFVEPVAGNMGVVLPEAGFLQGLRNLCTANGSLLVFDEVITGFRLGLSGAQGYFNVTPDLTTMGKIIGGGLPLGVYGGKAEIMDRISPLGPVYQAGTLSGNPIATAAGLAVLDLLEQPGFYESLNFRAEQWENSTREALSGAAFPFTINRLGSMMTLFFTESPVSSYAQAVQSDTKRYGRYFSAMLGQGVYLAPAQFEAAFISCEHSEKVLERSCEAIRNCISGL